MGVVDFFRDAYTGDVDTLTGFAVVASLRTCFVWKYSQVRLTEVHVTCTNPYDHLGTHRHAYLLHLWLP